MRPGGRPVIGPVSKIRVRLVVHVALADEVLREFVEDTVTEVR